MRILQLINNLGSGGAEKLIAEFTPVMAQQGHYIEVLLLRKKGSIYIEQLEKQGIKTTILSESSLYSIFHIWKIRQFICKGNFDIVHVHIFPALYFAALATLLGIGKSKLCFTEHSTKNKRMENRVFRLIDKWIYHFYKAIICITDDVKSNLQKHLQNKRLQYITVLNGINLSHFTNSVLLNKESLYPNYTPNDRIVTMVARFSEHKDQATLIKSFQQLPKNVHLLLVGEGPLKGSLQKLVSELYLSNRIHFLGLRKDVPDILRLCDIGVLSSNWEGFGLAAVEKMAAGIPVIVTNVDGLSSVVGEAGILFKKGNSKELAAHINLLLSDSDFYAARAIACKKQAQKYSIEKMVKSYLDIYELMVNKTTKSKLIRTSTVPQSLFSLLKGQLQMLSDEYEVIGLSSPGKPLQTVSEREGIRTIGVPMERRIALFKDIISLFRLIRVFRKEKPTIVHSITPKAGLLTMLAGYVTGVPIRIHTFTGLIFPTSTGFKQKLLIAMDRLTCFCATKIIPEGNGVRKDLIKYRITNKPLEIIANGNVNGIDLSHFDRTLEVKEQATTWMDNSAFTFCFVGRLVKDKGINELINAFKKLHNKYPNVRLILVGSFEPELDPVSAETEKEIHSHPTIQFVGYQKDIRPFLTASDALVFPSYREGFPNVVLQAGAIGLPSIVTDINGCNEIIHHGKNGVIIPPRNEEALLIAMTEFISNRRKRENMASASRSMIADRFDQKLVWSELNKMYKKQLENVR